MAFLDRLTNNALSPTDAGLICAVTALSLGGQFGDIDRRLISLFRDQFPPLSYLAESEFNQGLDQAVSRVQTQNLAADVPGLMRNLVAPAVVPATDRVGLYRYIFALAMADLNVNPAEGDLLAEMRTGLGLNSTLTDAGEAGILSEYGNLHRALAAAALGLIVVTADGVVEDAELAAIRSSRSELDPIGKLDDNQFNLVYDLGMMVHDRFLLDPTNRNDFLNNIVAKELADPQTRLQAFHYAAAIATSDGDIAQTEIDTLKTVLQALAIPEDTGETIFNQYMTRVKTIDGKPTSQ